ncbi:choline/ethanolaminephosphotransferase 1-like [Ptychodera flava]|uniref:choline/ethanolaminephosphotransferase 1-like n=1 Tax=Ptychodera flava TaxID=63121 RepID=UPI003969EA76
MSTFTIYQENSSDLEPFFREGRDWTVDSVPSHIDQTTLTAIGLSLNLFTSLLLLYCCPTSTEERPNFVYTLCTVGVSLHQTVEAMSGRQWRKPKSCLSLSKVFNHEMGSLSVAFVVLSWGCVFQFGYRPVWMFYVCSASIFTFYSIHWHTYFTGVVRFAKLDFSEAQIYIVVINLAMTVLDPDTAACKVFYTNLELRQLAFITTSGLAIFSWACSVVTVLSEVIYRRKALPISGVHDDVTMMPIIPMATVLLVADKIVRASPGLIYKTHPGIYILTFGLVAVKDINKLKTAKISGNQDHIIDAVLIGPITSLLNQFTGTPFNESHLLWLVWILAICDLVRYITKLVIYICYYGNCSEMKKEIVNTLHAGYITHQQKFGRIPTVDMEKKTTGKISIPTVAFQRTCKHTGQNCFSVKKYKRHWSCFIRAHFLLLLIILIFILNRVHYGWLSSHTAVLKCMKVAHIQKLYILRL